MTHHPREIAQAALGHVIGSDAERAYRRGDALQRRRVLTQDWAAYCSGDTARTPRPWEEPPEILITRVIKDTPPMHPDDIHFKQGYAPLAAVGIDQADGSMLLFQWVIKDREPDVWRDTPDGAQDRAEKLSTRLNSAWSRTKALT